MNEPFEGFWKRLKAFMNNVEVGDMAGEEEKEMILHTCEGQMKVNNFDKPDVSRQVCAVMNCGKEICKKSRIYCQEHEDDIY